MFAFPALFRLFSGPCREITCTSLPRKIKKGRVRRSRYGCYPVNLTSSQKIKRAMSFALVVLIALWSVSAIAANKKTSSKQSWQSQCLKSDKGLSECCAEKEAECKKKGTDEQACSDQLHACTTVEVSSFSSGSSSKKSKLSSGSSVSTVQTKLKAAKIKSAKK